MKTLHNKSSKFIFVLLAYLTFSQGLFGLELTRVILATNNNPMYIEFWPVVAPIWQAMGLRPTLALISDENCMIDTSIGDVIRFDPIPGISEALQAQTVRLLLPALFPDDVCIISDIDMLPISKSYFVDYAKPCPEDTFLVYRDTAWGPHAKRYAMCYFAAKGSLFQSIFSLKTYKEIRPIIEEWNTLGLGWDTDEKVLYKIIQEWEKNGGHVMRLGHSVMGRIDRSSWSIPEALDVRGYIDCHCPRPYSEYQDSIDYIVEAIYAQLQ